MKKTARKKTESQGVAQVLLPVVGLLTTIKGTLFELVMSSGMSVLRALLEQEREQLCGVRYRHEPERRASRAGYAPGELVLGGRRVSFERPRVRTKDGKEVTLPSWETFSSEDPLNARAVEQMVLGVSTRRYKRSLEPSPSDMTTRGTSKSAVSRRFVAATTERLAHWAARKLSELALSVLMVDGIVVGEHTVLVALGIDEGGEKHILGFWEGATENTAACTALLSNLVERGLDTTRSILVVIDGAKAIAKAVRDVFGVHAMIQRCQVHKKRNVLDHLPEAMRLSVGSTITTAYQCRDANRAKSILNQLARQLERKHPGAAASLREGLAETVTVTSLQLPEELAKVLVTTNAIENINGTVRRTQRNVKTWQGGGMVLRWVGVGLLEAEKGFRRVKGYKEMPKLVAALRKNDARIDGSLAPERNVA